MEAIVRVTVLGATGRTGRLVVEEALRRGHEVSVLVRDPGKLGELAARVRVVAGDARDAAAVSAAVRGADAVVSAVGPVGKVADQPKLHRQLAEVLVAAMREAGVRRFVGVSGAGVDAPGDRKSRRDRVISKLVHRFGGEMVADREAERETWAGSGLDWTLVRAPRLADGAPTGRVASDAVRTQRSTKCTRADLARFVLDEVETPRYVGAAPFVANA